MLLILIQYLYYSFLSQFIHMSHTSSHHGLECPCLLSFFCRCQILPEFQHKIHMKDFFQMIFTSSWHEHVDDLQSFLCMQPFISCDIYNEHHFYIQPDVDVQIFKSSFKITMITYSNEKKNLQHHYPYPNNVNMKVYIHFV